MHVLKTLLLVVLWPAIAAAEPFIDMPLSTPHCETFSVGESGHSDRCTGPAGYGLIIHYRRSRINLEITRPNVERGVKVHRLVDYLGDGQRHLTGQTAESAIRWYLDGSRPAAFAMAFDVEPRAYEATIPLTLIFRIDDGDGAEDCPIATIGEGSKRVVDDVMKAYAERTCRVPFPTGN